MSTTLLTALIARCRVLGRPRSPAADAELLQRFAQRHDVTAFEELLERYASLVWGVCRRILSSESDCEDAFQATFLALVRRPDAVAPSSSLGAWLHTVALRTARKTQARMRRQRPQAVLPESTTNGDVADELSSRELFRLVDEEIEGLPESLRLPLILCCLQGRTRDEVAEALACSVSAVKGRLERGRDLLRRRLERRGVQLPVAFLVVGLTAERVRAVLWAKTMQAVLYTPTPAIVALAEAGASALTFGKGKLLLAMVLLATTAVGAVGSLLTTTQRQEPPSATPTEKTVADPPKKPQPPQVRTDRYGDPLPDGAIARLGTVRWRHGFFVNALAYSPDGKKIAAAGCGRALTLWDAATGKEIHRFPNDYQPLCAAFSPDGKILAAPGRQSCCLWDVVTGKELRQLKGQQIVIHAIAFSSDGQFVATTSTDGTMFLWDPSTGIEKRRIDCGQGGLYSTALSPDGKWLATGGKDGSIRLWDSATGKEQRRLSGPEKLISHLAFSPDGKRLASSSEDGAIRLWDTTTGRKLHVLGEKVEGWSLPIAFSPDGILLASGHSDGTIRLQDTASGEEKRRWRTGVTSVRALAFSPDGKTLAAGAGWDGDIRFWDAATGKERHPFEEHHGFIDSLRFFADNRTLVSIGRDRRVLWWDVVANRPQREFAWTTKRYSGAALSPDGNRLAVSGYPESLLRLWDVRTGKPILAVGKPQKEILWAIAFSPDGRLVAAASKRGKEIHVWSVEDGKEIQRIEKPATRAQCLRFSPDGKSLACGMWEEPNMPTLRLWDMASGKERCSFNTLFPIESEGLAFSPDGKILASGDGIVGQGGEHLVRLWDAATGKELCRHTGHREGIGTVAFSPDGKLVASGTGTSGQKDNSVHIWEAATGRLLRRFEGHHSCVGSVAFSPDGLMVASGAGDSTILLWDITGRRPDGHWHTKPLTPRHMDACWADLVNEDAAKAYDAVWALVSAPEQAVPFLRKHLSPIARPDAKAVARWIADLDSEDFSVRQRATDELRKLGDAITAAFLKALADKPTLEMRRRLQQLLDQTRDWTPERLRDHRAIQALEHMNTRSARAVLQALAEGVAETQRTEEAKAALRRREQR